jgi:two-component system chemotaxis response regulator CheB
MVAIGVSTGGPNALLEVIPKLPPGLDAPILIVQHMPYSITSSLARRLDQRSVLKVVEATDKDMVLPNVVFMAPGGKHMVIEQTPSGKWPYISHRIRITDDPPVNGVKPSVDKLFCSLAEDYRGNVLSVIMTGMGNDGLSGVRCLKPKGGYCITQSADTCIVYGMPRALDEAALSDESVPLFRLAERIAEIVKKQ